jgi:benzoate-CoA ligase
MRLIVPRATTAADLGIPETFNAATHFVDRHLHEGRGGDVAIECGNERVTYAQLAEGVNRFGSSLRETLDVRPEERVLLLLLDGPAFASAFFGAVKIGAVPVPVNTLWKAPDYRYVLRDSRARVLVVSEELLPEIAAIARIEIPALRHIIVAGRAEQAGADRITFSDLLARGSATLDPEPTSRDAPAFWLYSSGSTGAPKACVHLHHDMVICAELFARGVLDIGSADRCFSVAKLFFAYGLGNGLYFPLAVGATSVLWPGAPTAANVYTVIERHRPTLLFSVPTGYGMLLAYADARRDGSGTACDLSSVRLAVSAGEALPPALYERFKRRFGIDIIDGIGSTKCCTCSSRTGPG